MSKPAQEFFDEDQLARINLAVQEAEKVTSGEIVPVLATRSDSYERAKFLVAIWATIIGTLLLIGGDMILTAFFPPDIEVAVEETGWEEAQGQGGSFEAEAAGATGVETLETDPIKETPGFWSILGHVLYHGMTIPLYVVFPVQIALMVGGYYLAGASESLHKAFIPHAFMQLRVDRAAHECFHRFRLSQTRDATGVLIYVSLFERMVVVLPDHSIADKHDQETWNGVRDKLIAGMQSEHPENGFIDAIAECGNILSEHFPIKSDDTNELPNHLRVV